MRKVSFTPQAYKDFIDWSRYNVELFQKINELIKESLREPFKGIGKPEPLKGNLKGCWSRRINQEHRLVYIVNHDELYILSCHGHYE